MNVKNFIKRIYRTLKPARIYTDDNKKIIAKYTPKNPIIIEAGTCDARDTLQMLQQWKKSKIYTFEPIPELFSKASEKLKNTKNVKMYPLALSNINGEAEIHVSGGLSDGSSSILPPLKHLDVHPDVSFTHKIKIKCVTLDEWVKKEKIEKIDLMWLDMQGMEYNALQAGQEILKNTQAIFTEVSLIETHQGVILYPEFRKWLESCGFEVVWEDLPYKDMGNVLFVRK